MARNARRRRPATASRSGSTPRARPASRRRRCMCMPTSADQRSLCRADPRHHRERRLLLGGEAVLRLWARQRDDVSAVGRRDHGAAAGPADAGRRRGAAAPASGHGVLRGADLLRRVPGEPGGAAARRAEAALLRLRRRSAAARHRPALARALRRRHPRRARLDRDAAHLPLQPSRRREVRHVRQAGAGLRHPPGRRRRQRDRDSRRDGRAAGARPDQRGDVLEQPRAVAHDLPRRVDALRRQIRRRTRTATTSTAAGATTC